MVCADHDSGDPHLQAAEEGLTASYMSPMRDQLHPWAISQAESANNKTIGIYSGALGLVITLIF